MTWIILSFLSILIKNRNGMDFGQMPAQLKTNFYWYPEPKTNKRNRRFKL